MRLLRKGRGSSFFWTVEPTLIRISALKLMIKIGDGDNGEKGGRRGQLFKSLGVRDGEGDRRGAIPRCPVFSQKKKGED